MGKIVTLASPESGSSVFLSLLSLTFASPGSQVLETGGSEHAVNVLAGECAVRIEVPGGGKVEFEPVGSRKDIFGGKPEMVYVPAGSRYEVVCGKAPFEAAIYTAPTDQIAPAAHVKQDQVRSVESGKLDWRRQVHIAMGDTGPATRMMLGETDCPPGNWSGFPPHRHAMDQPPGETKLEEIYYFKFEPETGFIIGGIYDNPEAKEEARLRIFRHGQVFDVPEGYHFLAPCPGYRVRYTWGLGGRIKMFGAWKDDPELAWLHNA